MKFPASFTSAVVLISSVLAVPAFAGSAAKSYKSYKETPAAEPVPLNYVELSSSYVAESEFDGEPGFGEQDAVQLKFRATRRFQLDDHWYFKAGLEYERFDFGSSGAPVPNHLQSIAAVIALEYLVNGDTGVLIETKPGVYFQNDISTGAFDAPTVLALAYPVFGGDQFYLIGGVSLSMLREYPAVPFIGALWHITPQLALRAYLPEPKLVYTPNEHWSFWVGGELLGGGYKTDHRGGLKPSRLSGAVVTYSDVRAGGGVAWKPCPGAKLELSGGWSFERSFHFHRAEKEYSTEGAPYAKLALILEF